MLATCCQSRGGRGLCLLEVVEEVEDVDEADNGATHVSVRVFLVNASAENGPDEEGKEHANSRDEQNRATSETINVEGDEEVDEQRHGLGTAVDAQLVHGGSDADTVKNELEVVGDNTVAGPLTEDSEGNNEHETTAVTASSEEVHPLGVGVGLLVHGHGSANLVVLNLDDLVIDITLGVVLGEHVESILVAVLGNHETRALRNPPDDAEDDNGAPALEKRGSSPCPVAGDLEGAECDP